MTGQEPTVRIEAPAKINLGLEILGRRQDGYHEIRSILAMIDLTDTLTISPIPSNDLTSQIVGMDIEPDDNLIVKASHLLGQSLHVEIDKHIPMAAGLGGASSDAAATLFAGNALQAHSLSTKELLTLAGRIGSDVPFFLGSPCAMVSATGTDLTPLPAPSGWIVLATPALTIPQKTATLYANLRPADFSDGSSIATQADRLRTSQELDTALLRNAFSRALDDSFPELQQLKHSMRDAGCPFVALSGAGPTHYTIVKTKQAADRIAANLHLPLSSGARVMIAKIRQTGLSIEKVGASEASMDPLA
ncbi:MAG: 4-(cytidine 5'-diphospho)-2-C-methyl-D-erythritol kinase [Thermomicrobiales bacterium]